MAATFPPPTATARSPSRSGPEQSPGSTLCGCCHHGSHARYSRQFFGRALRIAAGNDDSRLGVYAVRAADEGTRCPVRFAVTLHVFTTTTSAAEGNRSQSPAARRRSLTASPSARAALQPKCSTWKVDGMNSVYGSGPVGMQLRSPPRREKSLCRKIPVYCGLTTLNNGLFVQTWKPLPQPACQHQCPPSQTAARGIF